MFSKLIVAASLLLAIVAGTAQADTEWNGPLVSWLRALRTEQNIHNAEQWIGNFAEVRSG